MPTTPATSSVENSEALAPPTPWPIFGNTYVNTNTSNSGCRIVRGMNSLSVFRRTTRSRRMSERNATRAAATGLRLGASVAGALGIVTAVIRAGPSRSG